MREYYRCLLKLKFLKGTKVTEEEYDVKNLPENIIYNDNTGTFIKIDTENTTPEDLDRFLKVKNAYNFKVITFCVVTCTVFFMVAVCTLVYYLAKYL